MANQLFINFWIKSDQMVYQINEVKNNKIFTLAKSSGPLTTNIKTLLSVLEQISHELDLKHTLKTVVTNVIIDDVKFPEITLNKLNQEIEVENKIVNVNHQLEINRLIYNALADQNNDIILKLNQYQFLVENDSQINEYKNFPINKNGNKVKTLATYFSLPNTHNFLKVKDIFESYFQNVNFVLKSQVLGFNSYNESGFNINLDLNYKYFSVALIYNGQIVDYLSSSMGIESILKDLQTTWKIDDLQQIYKKYCFYQLNANKTNDTEVVLYREVFQNFLSKMLVQTNQFVANLNLNTGINTITLSGFLVDDLNFKNLNFNFAFKRIVQTQELIIANHLSEEEFIFQSISEYELNSLLLENNQAQTINQFLKVSTQKESWLQKLKNLYPNGEIKRRVSWVNFTNQIMVLSTKTVPKSR